MYNPFTFLNYSICVEQSCVYLNSSRFSWQKFSIFFLLLKYFNLLWCFCKILKYIWHINWLFLLDTNLFSLGSSCCWKTLPGSKVWVASWSWLIEQWLGASFSLCLIMTGIHLNLHHNVLYFCLATPLFLVLVFFFFNCFENNLSFIVYNWAVIEQRSDL